MGSVKVNENTGHYSQAAYDQLQQVLASAKSVKESDSYETVSEAYNTLSDALNDFLSNGRNPGGEPEKLNAVDITEDKLHEASGFSREDKSVSTRFAKPEFWTVENFSIPNGGDGTKQGLDKYPGYDCLMLGIWGDRSNNEEGDLSNARIYQKVHLEAGRYYFGNTFQTRYNLSKAYLFASSEPLATDAIEQESLAWLDISTGGETTVFNGIFFTLEEAQVWDSRPTSPQELVNKSSAPTKWFFTATTSALASTQKKPWMLTIHLPRFTHCKAYDCKAFHSMASTSSAKATRQAR